TGTVQEGALFTEEYLPQDSILYSLAFFSKPFGNYNSNGGKYENLIPNEEAALGFFIQYIKNTPVFQAGGNATLGKGILRIQLLEGKNDSKHK
ncbi:MAG: hypothetical protein N3A69_13025, partial [Leptospiraceae bacterium]|nr:hypothetical protein [Leptospiraceae bacterium]